MTWIHLLSKNQTPFFIYKMYKGDSLIIKKTNQIKTKYIILQGILLVYHVFTNQEIVPINILYTNHILTNLSMDNQSYYKYIALKTTYILSFDWNNIQHYKEIQKQILNQILYSYDFTMQNSMIIPHILIHKNIKARLMQVIIFLSIQFGIIKKQNIIIPLTLPKIELATIVGSNINTINRILKELYKYKILTYSKQKICIYNLFSLKYYSYLLR